MCELGFNAEKGCFTQFYGSDQLDASLLMIPLVGFLPATDPRVRSTIEAIERELVEGDFVLRYRTADSGEVDGLTGREGAFLACSFWLADCLTLLGRTADARKLLDRLLDLRNDLGLLAEEYDPVAGRLVGNFPQAFSHVSLVNSAAKIGGHAKPTADHVFLGLARQAMAGTRKRAGTRHLAAPVDPALRNLVSKVTKRPGRARPTSQVGGTTAVGRTVGRPARKVMTRQPAAELVAARREGGVDEEGGVGQEGHAGEEGERRQEGPGQEGALPRRRRPAKKGPAKKAPAKKAPVEEGTGQEGTGTKESPNRRAR